jgi:excisionase family DNA binding protein
LQAFFIILWFFLSFSLLTYLLLSVIVFKNIREGEFMGEEKKDVLTLTEAADAIRMSKSWLYKNLEKGPKYRRLGRKILYNRSDINEWLNRGS